MKNNFAGLSADCVSSVTERRKCERSQSSNPHLKSVAVPLFQVICISVEFPWQKKQAGLKDSDFTKEPIHNHILLPGLLIITYTARPFEGYFYDSPTDPTACSSSTVQTNSWALTLCNQGKLTETDFHHHLSHVTTEAQNALAAPKAARHLLCPGTQHSTCQRVSSLSQVRPPNHRTLEPEDWTTTYSNDANYGASKPQIDARVPCQQ